MSNQEKSPAWHEGYQAAERGKGTSANRHTFNSDEYWEWMNGYDQWYNDEANGKFE